jgi:uncharacterized protein
MAELVVGPATLVAIAAAFTVSASAGLGGSLILVPALALTLGTKEGVALAALLLACNNVVKLIAYRDSLPCRASAVIVAAIAAGTFVGARLLVAVPERAVAVAVIMSLVASLLVEQRASLRVRRSSGPLLAMASGATSGFTGTSGPLKGIAIRSLALDRLHTVGAASLASVTGDAVKTVVFVEAGILGSDLGVLALASLPLMVAATFAGRRINQAIGEAGFKALFWTVIGGYGARLLVGL